MAAPELTGVTHLFNAMGPLGHRELGAAGAALTRDHLACSIIADGIHVHWDVVRLAWRAKPRGKLFLVTDAMAPVGAPTLDEFSPGRRARARGGWLPAHGRRQARGARCSTWGRR